MQSVCRFLISMVKERTEGLKRVIHSTAGMYGDLERIIGASLRGIKLLELAAAERAGP